MNKKNKRILSFILTLAIAVLFAWYFFANLDDFKILLNISLPLLLLTALVIFGGLFINGIFMKIAISLFDNYIGIKESVRVSLISSAGNFFAPSGSGLGFRAIYLKKRFKLSYSNYVAVTICNYMFVFIISAAVGILSLVMMREYSNRPEYSIILIFLVSLMVASIGLFFVRFRDNNSIVDKIGNVRIVRIIKNISRGWNVILTHRKSMIWLIVLIILNLSLNIFSYYLISSSLDVHIPFEGLLLFGVLGSLSTFVNITPGNFGVKEAVYLATSVFVGLSTAQILSIAVVERVVLFVVLTVVWVIYGRGFHKSPDQDIEM